MMNYISSSTISTTSAITLKYIFDYIPNDNVYDIIGNVDKKLRKFSKDIIQKSKFLLTTQEKDQTLTVFSRGGRVSSTTLKGFPS